MPSISSLTADVRCWSRRNDGGAFAFPRLHFEYAAKLFGALVHALQTVSLAGTRRIETNTVIRNSERKKCPVGVEIYLNSRTLGMSRGVVDSFFENQQEITPHIHAELQMAIRGGCIELQINVPQRKNLVRMLAHLPREISQTISFRVNGPNDVAH